MSINAYVQYWVICRQEWKDGKMQDCHKLVHACGSDQLFILDGRNTLDNMIQDAIDNAMRKRNVKRFAGFTIHRGDLHYSRCIHSSMPTGDTVFPYDK